MSRPVSNVNLLTDTFHNWLEGTNGLLNALSFEIITANSTYANTGNTAAPRHAQLFGSFTSNTLIASGTIRGGNVSSSANLFVSSNATFNGDTVSFYSTGIFNNTVFFNSNTSIVGPTLTITANVGINTSNVFVVAPSISLNSNSTVTAIKVTGNSSVTNTVIGGNHLLVNSNTTSFPNQVLGTNIAVGNVAITNNSVTVGNSTVNVSIIATGIIGNGNTQFNIANTTTTKASTSVLVGANVYVLPDSIVVGNSTVNVSIVSSGITISGSNVWSVGNDGAGSGMDADLLDGEQGAYYRNADNINAGTLNPARMPSAFANTNVTGYVNATSHGVFGGTLTVANSASVAGPITLMTDYVMEVASNANLGNTQFARVIYSFPKATYRSAKVMVLASQAGNNQMSEMVIAHDNATPYVTVYGVVASPPSGNSSSPLGTYQVQINNANVELLLAQTRSNTAVKVVSHLIK